MTYGLQRWDEKARDWRWRWQHAVGASREDRIRKTIGLQKT